LINRSFRSDQYGRAYCLARLSARL